MSDDVTEQFDVSAEYGEKYCSGKAWPLPGGSKPVPRADGYKRYDVVISGAGPAGLLLRLCLARYGFGDDSVLCVESKAGQTITGHADGVQARTIEMLATLGLEHVVTTQARRFTNRKTWNLTPEGLQRGENTAFSLSPSRFGLSYTIHQGRIEAVMKTDLDNYAKEGVKYSTTIDDVRLDEESDPEFPVVVTFRKTGAEVGSTVRARYVVGADGAHSIVRQKMGIQMKGSAVDEVWGVVDFVPETNFPDSRHFVVIQDGPNKMCCFTVPREQLSNGEYLCRIYTNTSMDFDHHKRIAVVDEQQREQVRQKKAAITKDHIFAKIAKIYAPYTLTVKPGTQPVWWATYSCGQRLAEKFHLEDSKGRPRVLLVGDSCHTHSPSQGQGMNISMGDAYYLSWRLAYALNDLTPDPTALLRTYSSERYRWAEQVVTSDRRWNYEGMPLEEVWQEMAGQVLGLGIEDSPSLIVAEENEGVAWKDKNLLSGVLKTGRRLFNVPVTRYADHEGRDLHEFFPSDGRYRILLLASGDFPNGRSAAAVNAALSLVHEFPDQLVELVVVTPPPESIENFSWEDMPTGLKSHAEMRVLFADLESYKTYCVDPEKGAFALARPDGMVAITTELEGVGKVESMLHRVLKPRSQQVNGTM